MVLKDIIHRKSPAEYTEAELIFTIEQYVLKKKNKTIKINIHPRNNGIFEIIKYQKQLKLLQIAFDVAQKYFIHNGK